MKIECLPALANALSRVLLVSKSRAAGYRRTCGKRRRAFLVGIDAAVDVDVIFGSGEPIAVPVCNGLLVAESIDDIVVSGGLGHEGGRGKLAE